MYDRDVLLNEMRSNVIEVMFTKVNGESRTMRCTLRPDLLPKTYKDDMNEEKTFHKTNENVIACWDVEASGWRSFRIDSVNYVQQIDNY